MKITIKLVISTTTVKSKGSLSVLRAPNIQQQLKVTMYITLPEKKQHRPAPKLVKKKMLCFGADAVFSSKVRIFTALYLISFKTNCNFYKMKNDLLNQQTSYVSFMAVQTRSINNLSLWSQSYKVFRKLASMGQTKKGRGLSPNRFQQNGVTVNNNNNNNNNGQVSVSLSHSV